VSKTSRSSLQALYLEIGSPDNLRVILDDFYAQASKDAMIGYFFLGKDLNHIASQQTAFLLKAMGESAEYTGKGPAQAHHDLPKIRTGHFNRRLQILKQVLMAHGLPNSSIEIWIEFEESFRLIVSN
jgi:truncated hemoglobin YjbI